MNPKKTVVCTDSRGPLSTKSKVAYSASSFGGNLAYNFYYLFFIYFLTDFAGMSPALAGTVSLISVVWDAVTDPYIGYRSDISRNPKGRRRPWILRFSVPLAVMVVLLFVNVPLTGTPQFIYFVVANILFWMIFTAVDIPCFVLGSEITRDNNERITLRWMCSSANYFSMGLAGYALTFVFLLEAATHSYNAAWTLTAVVFAVLVTGGYLIAYKGTAGREVMPTEEQRAVLDTTNIIKSIIACMKIKPYVYILLYDFFFMTGIMVFTSGEVYLFQNVMGLSELFTSNIYLIYSIIVIFLSPVVGKMCVKMGNGRVLFINTIIATAGFLIYKFIPFTTVSVWGILITCAFGATGFFVVSYAIMYDLAELGCLKTGTNNEGVMVSFYSFILKVGTAVGMWLLGIILTIYNYDPVAISDTAITGIINGCTIVPAIISAISAIFAFMYKIRTEDVTMLRAMKESGNIDEAIVNKYL